MSQNPVNPTESFGATKSKAVTEEDVRVSGRINLKDYFETDVSPEDRLKRQAELELMLIARFETVFDHLIYLGSAGSINVESSELRVMAARALANLMFDVQTGLGQEVQDDNERVEREQKEGAKAFQEQQKKHEEDNSVPEPTSPQPLTDATLRSTQPEQELEFLARHTGKSELVDESPKLVKEDSVVDANRTETSPHRENAVVATGKDDSTPAEPATKNPQQSQAEVQKNQQEEASKALQNQKK